MRLGTIEVGMTTEIYATEIVAIEGAILDLVLARRNSVAAYCAGGRGCAAYSNLDALLSHSGLKVIAI